MSREDDVEAMLADRVLSDSRHLWARLDRQDERREAAHTDVRPDDVHRELRERR